MVERVCSCPNLASRKAISAIFCTHVDSGAERIPPSELPEALKDLGFDVTEEYTAGFLSREESLARDEFESLVAQCTLHNNDFPLDQLQAMFRKLCEQDGLLDLDNADCGGREKLNRFLRSNGVDLDGVDMGSKVSLSMLEVVIAQELDLKRRAEWLVENGVVRKLSSILPRAIFSGAADSTHRHANRLAENLRVNLPEVGSFINMRAEHGPQEPLRLGLRVSLNQDAANNREATLVRRSQRVKHGASALESGSPICSSASLVQWPAVPVTAESVGDGGEVSIRPRHNSNCRWMSASQPSLMGEKPTRKRSAECLSNGGGGNGGGNGGGVQGWVARLRSPSNEWKSTASLCDSEGGASQGESMKSRSSWARFGSPLTALRGERGKDEPPLRHWWEQYSASYRRGSEGRAGCEEDSSVRRGGHVAAACSILSDDLKGLLSALSWQLVAFGLLLWAILALVSGAAVLRWAHEAASNHDLQALHRAAAAHQLLAARADALLAALSALASALAAAPSDLRRLPEAAATFPPDPARPATHVLVEPAPPPAARASFEAAAAAVEAQTAGVEEARGWGLQLAPAGRVAMAAAWGSENGGEWGEVGMDMMKTEAGAEAVGGERAVMRARREEEWGGWVLEGVLPLYEEGGGLWGLAMGEVGLEGLLGEAEGVLGAGGDVVYCVLSGEGEVLAASEPAGESGCLPGREAGGDPQEEVEVAQGALRVMAAWRGGSRPWWERVCLVAAGVLSMVLASVCVALLATRRQHRQLLYRIMPPRVVKRLQQGRQVAEIFDDVTIFFSDLVGFTDMSTRATPLEVVILLNNLYTELDRIAQRHQVFKVDTIGDAYMVIGGAPERCSGPEAAARVARFALDALQAVKENEFGLMMRAGMASGSVVGAVLGTAVPKYSFFGDTVNTASRMESTGRPGRLQVTEQTMQLLAGSAAIAEFAVSERGSGGVVVKGKGRLKTYWVAPASRSRSPGGEMVAARCALLGVGSYGHNGLASSPLGSGLLLGGAGEAVPELGGAQQRGGSADEERSQHPAHSLSPHSSPAAGGEWREPRGQLFVNGGCNGLWLPEEASRSKGGTGSGGRGSEDVSPAGSGGEGVTGEGAEGAARRGDDSLVGGVATGGGDGAGGGRGAQVEGSHGVALAQLELEGGWGPGVRASRKLPVRNGSGVWSRGGRNVPVSGPGPGLLSTGPGPGPAGGPDNRGEMNRDFKLFRGAGARAGASGSSSRLGESSGDYFVTTHPKQLLSPVAASLEAVDFLEFHTQDQDVA